MDRHAVGHPGQQRRKRFGASGRDEDRLGPEARAREQDAQNHLALGDEAPVVADEIALADVEIGRDPRIGRIVDGQQGRHGALGSRTGFAAQGTSAGADYLSRNALTTWSVSGLTR